MSKFIVKYFRKGETPQFSSVHIFCPDNETITDMYKLVILKESNRRFTNILYFGNDGVPLTELEDYLDDMAAEVVKEFFDFLYTVGKGEQENYDEGISIIVEEWKEPKFLGTGDLLYGNW